MRVASLERNIAGRYGIAPNRESLSVRGSSDPKSSLLLPVNRPYFGRTKAYRVPIEEEWAPQ